MTYNWYLNERSSSTQARDYWEIDIENLDFSNGTTAPSFYLPIGGVTTIYKEPYSCKRISEMRKSLRLEKTIRKVEKIQQKAEMAQRLAKMGKWV